jgi:hypothetical protein
MSKSKLPGPLACTRERVRVRASPPRCSGPLSRRERAGTMYPWSVRASPPRSSGPLACTRERVRVRASIQTVSIQKYGIRVKGPAGFFPREGSDNNRFRSLCPALASYLKARRHVLLRLIFCDLEFVALFRISIFVFRIFPLHLFVAAIRNYSRWPKLYEPVDIGQWPDVDCSKGVWPSCHLQFDLRTRPKNKGQHNLSMNTEAEGRDVTSGTLALNRVANISNVAFRPPRVGL